MTRIHAVDDIGKTNDEILSQMDQTNKELGVIVNIISEIDEKAKVINDIVFQTKLLSFNASVEAARAGEHGKGFAVVAEEVGNLAEMSGKAANEIGGILTESINRVNEIVETTKGRVEQLMKVGKEKVAQGQASSDQVKEALLAITQNAEMISTMVSEIAHASQEQAQGVQEINKAISQLDQVTQQNSQVAQQSSSRANELSGDARDLEDSVRELVVFIHGKGKDMAEKSVTLDASSKRSEGKVLEMKKSEQRKVRVDVEKKGKKVVGGDHVPEFNEDDFEDF